MDFLRDDNIDLQPQLISSKADPDFHHSEIIEEEEGEEDEEVDEDIRRFEGNKETHSHASSPSVQKTTYKIFHHDHIDTLEDSKLHHLNEYGISYFLPLINNT